MREKDTKDILIEINKNIKKIADLLEFMVNPVVTIKDQENLCDDLRKIIENNPNFIVGVMSDEKSSKSFDRDED